MKIGDLVCWWDKRALIGVVVKIAESYPVLDIYPWSACKVQWANGTASTHSSMHLIKLEPSEEK